MHDRIDTLHDLYGLMWETVPVRRRIVGALLNGRPVDGESVDSLKRALSVLESLPAENGRYALSLGETGAIRTELTYEIEELKKDLRFLEGSEADFLSSLGEIHLSHSTELAEGLRFFSGMQFDNFITDRDGTVNNYCGRYNSSVQSAYNSVFLCRFARRKVKNAVMLTSAPLENTGLLDISVDPDGVFTYAGSKGREYCGKNGKRGRFPVEPDMQEKLDVLNERLTVLLQRRDFERFALIGSGLQLKFGQTTIARQDIYETIDPDESDGFLRTVTQLVRETDPDGKYFRIEDTGRDIEIVLTTRRNGGADLSDFDKGDGILFLDEALDLRLKGSENLICGDTPSDIPMVEVSAQRSDGTSAVFVTDDDGLKARVRGVCARVFFVSEPDTLVSLLYGLSGSG